jgi:protein SCO1
MRPFFQRRMARAGVAALVVLASALALAAREMRTNAAPVVYGHVPDFRLLDQRGEAFAPVSMQGHPSVVDFIFTRCASSCPRLTERMGHLQERLARERSATHLVSFSVDPENDTPAVLSEYASRAHADPARWAFVTGPIDDVMRTVVLGFKVSAAKIARGAGDYDVTHGDWFVLVDGRGDLRGYYASDDPAELERLVADTHRVEQEP